MINSRHIRHLASVLLRILPSCILIVAVSVSFVLTSRSAEAASMCGYVANHTEPLLHPDVMFLLFVVALMGLFLLITFVIRARRRHVLNGVEGMIGARVVAITPLAPEGRVNYFGENWAAILNIPGLSVRAGTELQIVSVQGLCLCVRPLHTDTRPVSNID